MFPQALNKKNLSKEHVPVTDPSATLSNTTRDVCKHHSLPLSKQTNISPLRLSNLTNPLSIPRCDVRIVPHVTSTARGRGEVEVEKETKDPFMEVELTPVRREAEIGKRHSSVRRCV